MPEKKDVRKDMREAAGFVSGRADMMEKKHLPPVAVGRLRLASLVLKHEAGAETVGWVCADCGGLSSRRRKGHECMKVLEKGSLVRHGPRCGGTLIELIPRYRGDDA